MDLGRCVLASGFVGLGFGQAGSHFSGNAAAIRTYYVGLICSGCGISLTRRLRYLKGDKIAVARRVGLLELAWAYARPGALGRGGCR